MTAFTREQALSDPKPLFDCLDDAIRCALHCGTDPKEMKPARWCETFHATREQFDEALTRALTRLDPNSCDGEGK